MVSRIVAKVVLLSAFVSVAAAQTAPPRKGIPAIAKAANGAVVSIVMSDEGGKTIAQGSGFFVSKDGLIVTNYHVIAEGSSAVVKLPDGAFYIVDGVRTFDQDRDIAVIKAHGQNFRTLTLGNSDRVQAGEEVVAIGSPLSLESSVSNGIVSGMRTVKEEGGKFLQITAPISPGSSGGPLFNMAGEVVGITTMHIEGGQNLNFAIPINDAKRLLKSQSTTLQKLPAPRKLFDRYHVVAYEPSSNVVLVRYGGKLITATVSNAQICEGDNDFGFEKFNWDRDCREEASIVKKLVGQDILTPGEEYFIHFDAFRRSHGDIAAATYPISRDTSPGPHIREIEISYPWLFLDEYMDRNPDGTYSRFHHEVWEIQKCTRQGENNPTPCYTPKRSQ
jgi:S1-C subfamily serine protease